MKKNPFESGSTKLEVVRNDSLRDELGARLFIEKMQKDIKEIT